jgi:hypothetical protein
MTRGRITKMTTYENQTIVLHIEHELASRFFRLIDTSEVIHT